ncbi:hypothetical protein BGZ80_010093 [Entomortierella chlamydospora]|uniref:Uncharacterized protein n=1 Tax=Entomortierella chlamydospora TaxID=101097 RepID=A0A9P6MVC0_9FUNG|nr:hypothetical protein BGZ79_008360 [Entomortierella chlamydospora]KAG0015028.1 hypothetical protein BGZ80_010093 [Entomortierella chlamydospora]
MANQYYKKDIHKSIEGLLTGLYVYEYLLDTSTSGVILRYIVQDQILSLKTKAPTLRFALYVVLGTAFLGFIRHLYSPDRYAVVIDFIGNVVNAQGSTGGQPSGGTGTSTRTLHSRSAAAAARSTPHNSNSSSQSDTQHPGVNDGLMTPGEVSAASSSRTGTQVFSSQARAQASLPLFEYTPQSDSSGNDPAEGYYVDEEETRHSLDNSPPNRTRHSTVGQGSNSSEADSGDTSDNSDSDEDDPLGDDYEEVLEQETFVVQLHFRDMMSYLFSNQETFSFSRIGLPAGSAAVDAEAMRVQNLPV